MAEPCAMRARTKAQEAAVAALHAGTRASRDEAARLKALPRAPSHRSGVVRATEPEAARPQARPGNAVTAERVCGATPPSSPFKDYQNVLVRELHLAAEVARYRWERWLTTPCAMLVASLSRGIVGGLGPGLRRFGWLCTPRGR